MASCPVCSCNATLLPPPPPGEEGLPIAIAVAIAVSVSVTAVLLLAVLLLLRGGMGCRPARAPPECVRMRDTGEVPTLPPLEPGEWHCFLSHCWLTGSDQPAVIKRQLMWMLPKPVIFLDVDDLDDLDGLVPNAQASSCVLLFLSKGYFLSRPCLLEVRAAVEASKPLILVHEVDVKHGGASLPDLMAECPEDVREAVFGRPDEPPPDVITWHRSSDMQTVSLLRMAEKIVYHATSQLSTLSGTENTSGGCRCNSRSLSSRSGSSR